MSDDLKSVVLELLCSTGASPWPDTDKPVLYRGQRLEFVLDDYSDDGRYMAGIHEGDLPVNERIDDARVVVAVSIPEGHFDRFAIDGRGELCAAQFYLAKFVIQSAKRGYWPGATISS